MKFILPILLIISGILFLFFGGIFLYQALRFKKKAIQTTGTVVEIKTSTGKTTSITYSPVIKFFTLEGKECIYDVSRYDYTKYHIGQKINVVYSRQNPAEVNVDSFYNIFLPSIIVLILAVCSLTIGLILYFRNQH